MSYLRTLCVMAVFAVPCMAETLQEVEDKIVAEMTRHKSIEMKMKMKMDYSAEGVTMKSTSESTAIYGKKGDKWLSRTDTKMTSSRKTSDSPEIQEDSRIMTVFDGEYMYTLTESANGKQAMRMKPGRLGFDPFNGKQMFEELHKAFDVKLLADETIDGKSTWSIEARPKPVKDAPPEAQAALAGTRSVTNYSKTNGVAVKSVTYDKNGKVMQQTTITETKYDLELKPDLFKFTAPPGVKVMDLSSQPAAPEETEAPKAEPAEEKTAEPAAEPKAEEKPAKEQPKSEKKGAKNLLNKLRR